MAQAKRSNATGGTAADSTTGPGNRCGVGRRGRASDPATLLVDVNVRGETVADKGPDRVGERSGSVAADQTLYPTAPGQGFTLINNHDPEPLCREFDAAHPGDFSWDYLQAGPD
jgi:hypothetical protein